MSDDDRHHAVRALLFDYVRSPSLRHVRDPHSLGKLAKDIMRAVDRESSYWKKWEGQREALLKASSECWVPADDLRDFLNEMPGPKLTSTDVAQRLRAVWEEPYTSYPNENLREGCLALYQREKEQGTELPAIIGALQEFVEAEEDRLQQERTAAWRKHQEEERVALEERFLSGADSKWTPVNKSRDLFRRINGRAYRLAQTNDKRWALYRINDVSDDGKIVGEYQHRGDTNKALAKIAYLPEPRW